MARCVLVRNLALFLSLLAPLGCSRLERAQECRELAATVNPRLGEIRDLSDGQQTPAELRSVAESYDGIADDLGPLEFHSKSMAQAVQEYGQQLRGLAAEARSAASALEASDKGAYLQARREVRARTGQLKSIQRRIEDGCRQLR
jgi:chromosome segregation ATPase